MPPLGAGSLIKGHFRRSREAQRVGMEDEEVSRCESRSKRLPSLGTAPPRPLNGMEY